MNNDLLDRLREHREWQFDYVAEAIDMIEQLKKENEELRADLKQLNEDFSGGLLVAHMNGVSSMRAELETVTKQRDELLEALKKIARRYDSKIGGGDGPSSDQEYVIWNIASCAIANVKGVTK